MIDSTSSRVRIVGITAPDGTIVEPAWLAGAESVHRELRPQIPAGYETKMRAIFADGGRMAVAVSGERVVGLTVYRIYEDTFNGRKFYCDDLVTTEKERSTGVGHALMQYMENEARAAHCPTFALDSGVQRKDTHKFYYREGMFIVSFNFKKDLTR